MFCVIAVQTVVHFVPGLPGLANTFQIRYTRYVARMEIYILKTKQFNFKGTQVKILWHGIMQFTFLTLNQSKIIFQHSNTLKRHIIYDHKVSTEPVKQFKCVYCDKVGHISIQKMTIFPIKNKTHNILGSQIAMFYNLMVHI